MRHITEEQKGREGKEEDVSSYWMPSWKREYWKWKEKSVERKLWRTRYGKGYLPVVTQTT